ncbi:tetratricopeptide repeat protein [Micromonospora sp. H61]|uniref:tetratricopeptide repeat protein n=1 Tax=Micromonospora sp. H61 TaxID=2824888 RepID=UPI001B39C484|nr:tetratricopeptide repeat protein [Micromonospora sp. H61]MBQ0990700.1 tetratricopeptide repeat protein [Micromonospora sp. H61]
MIADRLVLTSAHATVEVGQSVQVFPAGSPRTFTAQVVWRGTARGRDDAAIVQVVDPDWVAPAGRAPRWGRLVTDRPAFAHARGFPDWAQPDGHADTWGVTGTINPGSRVVADQYVLALDGEPPTSEGSPWAGLSGGGLFCGPLLVGVAVADVAGGGHGHLTAVPMSLLVRDPRVRQVLAGHGLADTMLDPVELRELAEPTAVRGQSPAALLTAQAQVVGFRGRELILDKLLEWCAGDDGFGMWLWHASGGQGKTRLGVELARRLSARRWATLWLRGNVRGSLLEVLAEVTVPLLVVVDYAETRTGQLAEVLRACTGHSGATQVRVLLLARTAGDWWSALSAADRHSEHLFDTARTTLLPVLDPEPGAYRQAVADLAVALAALPAHRGNDWPDIAARLAQDGTRVASSGPVSVLTVQMTALADLLDTALAAGVPQDRAGRPVEDRLLDHEHRWWWATARAEHLFPDLFGKKTLIDALSIAILFGADDHEHADALLRQLPSLADQSRDRRDRVQAWIGRLYPPPVDGGNCRWSSLQPDRLAERVTGLHLQEHPQLPDPLLSAATAVQRRQLITVYTRAAAQAAFNRALDKPLTDLVLRYPHLLAGPAIDVTTKVEFPGPLVSALRQLTADPQTSIDELTAMSDRLPAVSHNLAELAGELTQRLVDEYRHHVTNDPDAFLPDLATSLNNLSVDLGALGRREDGLAASKEAVTIRRQLAAARPEAFLPDLATSLNNLSVDLGALGRREDGLAASKEAVTIRRQLAAARPEAFLPDLAASLNNLSVDLGALGRREDGLAAIEEAVEAYRELAARWPAVFQPHLDRSMAVLAWLKDLDGEG